MVSIVLKPDDASDPPLHFSVIIPTYQRRALAVAAVEAFLRQEFRGSFEVIVVVDGSHDGTAEVLRQLRMPFPLTVLEQPNRGAATARNRGAEQARGRILLFLDDDMEADPHLLREHQRSHYDGADVVLGHMPLHPDSPRNVLSIGVHQWAEGRLRDLNAPNARLALHDLLTGQISVKRKAFNAVGGFDTTFTRGGTFGNEDIDFGYRLMVEGYRVAFNGSAVSRQKYIVGPRQHLRQWRQAGRADVAFARKHPERAEEIFALTQAEALLNRWLWRPLATWPRLTAAPIAALRWFAVGLVERNLKGRFTRRLFVQVRAAEYWRGVQEVGGLPRHRVLRVLAYHAIADLAGAPVLEPYGVPPDAFARQIQLLKRFGFHFVSVEEFLYFVRHRGGLPRRAVLLTFDDCFEDLLLVGLPILERHSISAVAFAVSRLLGRSNEWDQAMGAPRLPILDAKGLLELARRGIEIGPHSRTHRPLASVSDDELMEEVAGAAADLQDLGLRRPRLFAYPYGESDRRVETAVQEAGLLAAFTVTPGSVKPGQNPYRLPRIEILREDLGWRFLLKVFTSGMLAAPEHLDRLRRLRARLTRTK